MCGITGFAGFEDKALLKRMTDIIAYRGPDDHGYYSDRHVSLGHRRLSIIDLSRKGHQPMQDNDGELTIIFNGEIYNFRELRSQLEAKGHRFRSFSDTEVILAAYKEYGTESFSMLNGMFAFAIYDCRVPKARKLLLVRDRLGIKPLHYCVHDNHFLFASEPKSLLQHEGVKKRAQLNLSALSKFLNFNYIFGSETMFSNIYKLLPGHYLDYDILSRTFTTSQYWDLKTEKSVHSEQYYVEQTRKLLKEAVQSQLVSDVPLGVFLSGGIDSSSIVALMSQLQEAKKPIRTYAVGFNEPTDELNDARRVSEAFGTEHQEIMVESDALRHYPEFIWHMDTPKTNLSPQHYISKLARKSVTVALTGLGGDELFAGYRRHKYYYHQKTFSTLIPKFLAQPLFSSLSKAAQSNHLRRGMLYLAKIHDKEQTYAIAAPLLLYDDERKELYGQKLMAEGLQGQDSIKNSLSQYFPQGKHDYYDQALKMEMQTYLNDDLLERMDRMSMANSLEARVPFLDNALVDFAFSVPHEHRRFRLSSTSGKDLLVKAMKGIVPDFVFAKKKTGFNMSPYSWFTGSMKEHAANILTKERINELGLFNYPYIERILSQKPSQNLYYQYQTLWNLMSFDLWHKMFIENNTRKSPAFTIEDYYN